MNKSELIENIAKQATIADVKDKTPDAPKDKKATVKVLKTGKPIQNQVKENITTD